MGGESRNWVPGLWREVVLFQEGLRTMGGAEPVLALVLEAQITDARGLQIRKGLPIQGITSRTAGIRVFLKIINPSYIYGKLGISV